MLQVESDGTSCLEAAMESGHSEAANHNELDRI